MEAAEDVHTRDRTVGPSAVSELAEIGAAWDVDFETAFRDIGPSEGCPPPEALGRSPRNGRSELQGCDRACASIDDDFLAIPEPGRRVGGTHYGRDAVLSGDQRRVGR